MFASNFNAKTMNDFDGLWDDDDAIPYSKIKFICQKR